MKLISPIPKSISILTKLVFLTFIVLLAYPLSGQKEFVIGNATSPIAIDGYISDEEWGTSDTISGFVQLEPNKGENESEQTIVFSSHDDNNIYFAFKCFQKGNIIANEQKRDNLNESDDAIKIILDTYLDNRSGYGFTVNPINTQTDFKINDDGRSLNKEWDTEWESATGKFSDGWTVEIAIPFSSIKYKTSKEQWGVNFARINRNNSEIAWWSSALNANYRISQNGIMSGIRPAEGFKKFNITPYASVRYEDSDITGNYNKLIPDGGVDFQFRPTANLTLNGTINPDFASVEGDAVKIDLTGWEKEFSEKRLFFQESNDMYSMRYKLFYSRRIGDILYGTKFSGKAGKYAMNVIHTQSMEDTVNKEPLAYYTVARVKRDVFKSSTIGGTFVDKTSDTSVVRSYGLDWVMNPGTNWKITGQLIGSYPGDFIENSAGFLRVAHESSKHHVHIRYSDLGENFKDNVNQTGYIQDDDRREVDLEFEYKFWFKRTFIKYIFLSNTENAYWNHAGEFKGSKLRDKAKIYLRNDFALDFHFEHRTRYKSAQQIISTDSIIDIKPKFKNYFLLSRVGYNTDESSNATISYTFGDNFNREFYMVEGNVSVNPIPKLTLTYQVIQQEFTPKNPEDLIIKNLEYNSFINILSANYYFTNNLWLRLFAQTDSHNERIYVYGQFGWKFKPPFGAMYLVYAGDDYYNFADDIQYNSNTVFLKLAYPFNF